MTQKMELLGVGTVLFIAAALLFSALISGCNGELSRIEEAKVSVFNNTIEKIHDRDAGVTCWITYRGISCLRDACPTR